MLGDLVLWVFCLGGVLLVASVFRGEFSALGQVVRTEDSGVVARFVAGIIGVALVLAAAKFIPSKRQDLVVPGFCALALSGALALIASIRGRFSVRGLLLDGEAVGTFARGFAGIAAVFFAGFGLRLITGKPDSIASAGERCGPGFESRSGTCEPVDPASAASNSQPGDTVRPAPTAWHAQTYIQIASEGTQEDANKRAQREAEKLSDKVCVFQSRKSTAFGIVLGPLAKQEAVDSLSKLKAGGSVPNDALVVLVDNSQMRSCYPSNGAKGL